MKIAVIGTGYVGLVSGTCFAEMGNHVVCVDIDKTKVETLRSGKLTIYEPGLLVFFERALRENRLHFTTQLQEAIAVSDIIMLALPTPPGEDGAADLSYVLQAAKDIAQHINRYKVIVNKSTVPVGTADKVREIIAAEGKIVGQDFDVVSNPEFLREGVAVKDFMKPERVVIGTSSERATDLMKELYHPFVRHSNPLIIMDERSSEMTKYAANAFLATKITFMNEVANLCEKVGANVDMIRQGIGSDSRIGSQFLHAGIGFGGSCFPKDVQALAQTSHEHQYNFRILDAVLSANRQQHTVLIPKMLNYFGGSLENKHFALWGLAFKPNTDDVREAPAQEMIKSLLAHGATITAFDPEANNTTRAAIGDIVHYANDCYDALEGADGLVICTEWNEFRRPDFEQIKEMLRFPVVFDGRNLYDTKRMRTRGFDYYSIGRPVVRVTT